MLGRRKMCWRCVTHLERTSKACPAHERVVLTCWSTLGVGLAHVRHRTEKYNIFPDLVGHCDAQQSRWLTGKGRTVTRRSPRRATIAVPLGLDCHFGPWRDTSKFLESHWNGTIGKMGLSAMRGYHGGPLKFDNCEFFLLRDALRVQVVEGKMIVTLEQEDVEDYTKEWNNALILYIIGEAPSYAYLKAYSGITWNTVTFPEVFYQEKGFYIVKFKSVNDMDGILAIGPYIMNGMPFLLKKSTSDFDFWTEFPSIIPLWVRFYNLPLNCWGSKILSEIASSLGEPLFVDECTKNQIRVWSTSVEGTNMYRLWKKLHLSNQELNKWLGLQKKVFKKKVKAHWIEAGDGNNNYFFKCLKARANANAISALKDNSGRVLHKAQEIENGVLWFYSNLLGSSSFNMSAIDIPNMRLGQS
ncbi:hypothetical protein FXO38_22425 [Capsicum annuum]|nr:hypothetical protein FXO38_22425 [Capsicum annuum]